MHDERRQTNKRTSCSLVLGGALPQLYITHVAQSSVLQYDDGINDGVTLEKNQILFQCVD